MTDKPKNKGGRPPKYTRKLADEILARFAEGEAMIRICAEEGMPARSTVADWVINDVDGFAGRYARARDTALDRMAEEVMSIADDGSNDTYLDEDGVRRTNHDVIARSRLRFDARRWYLSKLAPKKYGEKLELAGNQEAPLKVIINRGVNGADG